MGSRPGILPAGSAVLGALLGLSFGWSWGWLSGQLCLTLLLLLWSAQARTHWQLARAAAAFGAGLGLSGLSSMPASLDPALRLYALLPLLVFTLVHALASGLSALLLGSLARAGLQRWLLLWPALWMVQEFALSFGPLAMPWLRLGVLQAPHGPFAALLPLGGSLLAGAAMWLLAGLLVLVLRQPQWRRRGAFAAFALLALSLAAQPLSWTEQRNERSLQVRLLQLPTATADADTEANTHSQSAAVVRQLLDHAARARNELLISPQLALEKTPQALPPGFVDLLQQSLEQGQSDLLLGMYLQADAGPGLHNGALALGVSGVDSLAKHQRLPFGEFNPFPAGPLRAWLQGLSPRAQQDTAAAPPRQHSLPVAGHRAAVSFCFELAFAEQWREAAAEADVLINISSDSSHPAAQQRRQFQQIAQARALEHQKPLLRSSDLGGGLALDHRGSPLPIVGERAVLLPRQGLTPYARWGEALALSLAALALLAAVAAASRRPVGRAAQALRVRTQTGQILMASLGLLLITAGLLYFLVNTGQTVTEKMRVTNAADAAAYSAGVVEARALNVDAYLNRAMVANEIVIAQMVSMASWLRYFASATDNIPGTMGDITFMLQPDLQALQISATFAAAKYGVSYLGMTAEELADYVVDYGIGPIITVHDAIVQTLSLTQSAIQVNLTAGIRQQQIANDLVQQMDPALKAELILTSHGFDRFTKAYSGQERTRFADVTSRSRDPFTRERNWTIDSFDIPLLRRDGALKKRGGTELIGFDEWRAVDTLELHGRRFGCGKLKLSWCDDIQTPIGWGAVNVNAGGGDAGRGHHGNAYGENGRTAGIADSDMREPLIYKFSGIPTSRDLRDLDPKAERSTHLTLLVSKSQAALMTSGGAAQAKPAGDLALFNDKPAGGQLMALSRAEVFFDRIAARADGKSEIASLYNPYWRVRLVAPTAGDKVYAATKQGGLALP